MLKKKDKEKSLYNAYLFIYYTYIFTSPTLPSFTAPLWDAPSQGRQIHVHHILIYMGLETIYFSSRYHRTNPREDLAWIRSRLQSLQLALLSRPTLPTPAHSKGWKPSAQASKPFPVSPAKGSSHLRGRVHCADSRYQPHSPQRAWEKAVGMVHRNARMGMWQGKEWETLTRDLFAQHLVLG